MLVFLISPYTYCIIDPSDLLSVSPSTPYNFQSCWPISAKDKNEIKALKRNLTSFIELDGWREDTEPDWCLTRNKASVTAQQLPFLIHLLLSSGQVSASMSVQKQL